jgi:hypothetical protein
LPGGKKKPVINREASPLPHAVISKLDKLEKVYTNSVKIQEKYRGLNR